MNDDVAYDSAHDPKSNIENLKQYFRIAETPTRYELRCLKCKQGWALMKGNTHPGNFLHLLNHAYSHIKK